MEYHHQIIIYFHSFFFNIAVLRQKQATKWFRLLLVLAVWCVYSRCAFKVQVCSAVLNCPVGSRALPNNLLLVDLVHCQSLHIRLWRSQGRSAMWNAVCHAHVSPVLTVPCGAVSRTCRSAQWRSM